MRIVVVGASSGLGRCVGVGLAQRDNQVALLARSHDKLVDAAKDAGAGALAIACDVTDEASCRDAISEAAAGLGGIDALVYTAGVGPLAPIDQLTARQWHDVFATNVVGASLITANAVPHLTASSGTAVYFSSVSASLTPPWPGLASYAVTKAALDKLVEAWRAEHPGIGFTRMIVGDCAGGEGDAVSHFANAWDRDLAARYMPTWLARGYMTGALVPVERLVDVVDVVLQGGGEDAVPTVVVAPRAPAQS